MKKFYLLLLFFFISAGLVAQTNKIPEKIPCRINDSLKSNIMFMTLGNPDVSIKQGYFFPYEDKILLNNGREINNYYKESLQVKYYKPIDKTFFPLPPSGWCSWYYYYQEISSKEIMLNADWLANNLKEYGADVCQIDDGWQGTGHGLNGNRDWTTIDSRFPEGMKFLAEYIKKKGFVPGLWLAPHGQSNKNIVDKWNNFLLDKNGKTASDTWEGTYLVDPTHKNTPEYFKNLFSTLTDWGFDYFKIDGQPIVTGQYLTKKSFMADSTSDPIEAYRNTLKSIKETIGPKRYLLGCWGMPIEGIGIMDGTRTYGDIVLDWNGGFGVAFSATMKYYYLHNIAWYCDPDVMLLRHPLTLDMARAWATLQGLSGQALLASDRMPDISSERVEILKRVFPAVDIRPVDLFKQQREKKIWDLKIKHLDRTYDIIGCFNTKKNANDIFYINWKELGIAGKQHIYDFWNKDYLGAWDTGYFAEVNPAACRVLTIVPVKDQPQLISTNRHITQGWIDLISENYDSQKMTYSGKSKVIKDDIYELTFAYPPGKEGYKIKEAKSENQNAEFINHDGFSIVKIKPEKSGEIGWEVKFQKSENYFFPVYAPNKLSYRVENYNALILNWSANYHLYAGYKLYCNGEALGIAQGTSAKINISDLKDKTVFELSAVWYDGTESKNRDTLIFNKNQNLSREIYLSDMEPEYASLEYLSYPLADISVDGNPITLNGKIFKKGLGTHAKANIIYDIDGQFDTFYSIVGLDDECVKINQGSVAFEVFGDGKSLWKSGVIKHDQSKSETCEVNIKGVKKLQLKVYDGGDGIGYDHADWGEAKIKR